MVNAVALWTNAPPRTQIKWIGGWLSLLRCWGCPKAFRYGWEAWKLQRFVIWGYGLHGSWEESHVAYLLSTDCSTQYSYTHGKMFTVCIHLSPISMRHSVHCPTSNSQLRVSNTLHWTWDATGQARLSQGPQILEWLVTGWHYMYDHIKLCMRPLWEVSLEIFFHQLIHTNSVHSLTDPFLPLVSFARSWILYVLKKWNLLVSQEVARSFLLILKGWHSEGHGLRPHAMLVSCCLAEVRPRWMWCLLVESAHDFRNFLDSFIESYKAVIPDFLGSCLTFHQVKSTESKNQMNENRKLKNSALHSTAMWVTRVTEHLAELMFWARIVQEERCVQISLRSWSLILRWAGQCARLRGKGFRHPNQ